MHKISPSCSVFETNLKAFSFEVVVAGLVLHLQGCSFEDSLRWIATLKAAINNSPPDETDPLLAEALRLEDTFYYVSGWFFYFVSVGPIAVSAPLFVPILPVCVLLCFFRLFCVLA